MYWGCPVFVMSSSFQDKSGESDLSAAFLPFQMDPSDIKVTDRTSDSCLSTQGISPEQIQIENRVIRRGRGQ